MKAQQKAMAVLHLFTFSMFERTKVSYVCLLQLGMAVVPNHRVGIGIIAFHIVIDIAGRLSLESVATCWVYRG